VGTRRVSPNRMFVSRSLGCFAYNPIFGVEITALCKKL
jgi:hypothetical protein